MGSATTFRSAPPGTFALELQKLRPDCQWAVADSNVLQAIARGTAPTFGRRGRRLRKLIGVFAAFGMASPLLLVVGICGVLTLLAAQDRSGPRAPRPATGGDAGFGRYPAYFFVGFGAGSEEVLYARYLAEHPDGVGRINQVEPGTWGKWHLVGFAEAARLLVAALRNAQAAGSSLPPDIERWRLDFLTAAGIRIAHYAFMRALFENLAEKCAGLQEVAFLAADTPAFAAIDAGLPTRYIQHGLVRHSLVLPRFDRVDALTGDESSHFRQRLPSAVIALQPSAGVVIASGMMSRGILVASVYAAPAEMQRVSAFIDWASKRERQVWVRPHPREDRLFWSQEAVRPRVTIEDRDCSFQVALARLRPRLVVSWFSTALADALAMGVIPVSLSAPDDPNVIDMVYPLHRRCLHWPHDNATIERVLDDDEAYLTELGRLRAALDEVPA